MAPRLVESCFFISKDLSTGGAELLEVDQKDIFKIAPFINNVTSRSVEKSDLAPLISKLHSVVFGKPINENNAAASAVNNISQQQNHLQQLRDAQRGSHQILQRNNNQLQEQQLKTENNLLSNDGNDQKEQFAPVQMILKQEQHPNASFQNSIKQEQHPNVSFQSSIKQEQHPNLLFQNSVKQEQHPNVSLQNSNVQLTGQQRIAALINQSDSTPIPSESVEIIKAENANEQRWDKIFQTNKDFTNTTISNEKVEIIPMRSGGNGISVNQTQSNSGSNQFGNSVQIIPLGKQPFIQQTNQSVMIGSNVEMTPVRTDAMPSNVPNNSNRVVIEKFKQNVSHSSPGNNENKEDFNFGSNVVIAPNPFPDQRLEVVRGPLPPHLTDKNNFAENSNGNNDRAIFNQHSSMPSMNQQIPQQLQIIDGNGQIISSGNAQQIQMQLQNQQQQNLFPRQQDQQQQGRNQQIQQNPQQQNQATVKEEYLALDSSINSGELNPQFQPNFPNNGNNVIPGSKLKACNNCEYTTPNGANLLRHIKAIHEKIRDYSCTKCDYECSQKQHLLKHYERFHPGVEPVIVQLGNKAAGDEAGDQENNARTLDGTNNQTMQISGQTLNVNSQIPMSHNTQQNTPAQHFSLMTSDEVNQKLSAFLSPQSSQGNTNIGNKINQQLEIIPISNISSQAQNVDRDGTLVNNNTQINQQFTPNSKQPFGNNMTEDRLYKCPRCNIEPTSLENLKVHVQAIHTNQPTAANDSVIITASPSSGQTKCPHCTYQSIHPHHLRRHIKAIHEKVMESPCTQCGYQTAYKSHMKRHMEAMHRMSMPPSMEDDSEDDEDLEPHQNTMKPSNDNFANNAPSVSSNDSEQSSFVPVMGFKAFMSKGEPSQQLNNQNEEKPKEEGRGKQTSSIQHFSEKLKAVMRKESAPQIIEMNNLGIPGNQGHQGLENWETISNSHNIGSGEAQIISTSYVVPRLNQGHMNEQGHNVVLGNASTEVGNNGTYIIVPSSEQEYNNSIQASIPINQVETAGQKFSIENSIPRNSVLSSDKNNNHTGPKENQDTSGDSGNHSLQINQSGTNKPASFSSPEGKVQNVPKMTPFKMFLESKVYPCPVMDATECQMALHGLKNLEGHIKNFHRNAYITISCTQCDYKTILKEDLEDHMESMHSIQKQTTEFILTTQDSIDNPSNLNTSKDQIGSQTFEQESPAQILQNVSVNNNPPRSQPQENHFLGHGNIGKTSIDPNVVVVNENIRISTEDSSDDEYNSNDENDEALNNRAAFGSMIQFESSTRLQRENMNGTSSRSKEGQKNLVQDTSETTKDIECEIISQLKSEHSIHPSSSLQIIPIDNKGNLKNSSSIQENDNSSKNLNLHSALEVTVASINSTTTRPSNEITTRNQMKEATLGPASEIIVSESIPATQNMNENTPIVQMENQNEFQNNYIEMVEVISDNSNAQTNVSETNASITTETISSNAAPSQEISTYQNTVPNNAVAYVQVEDISTLPRSDDIEIVKIEDDDEKLQNESINMTTEAQHDNSITNQSLNHSSISIENNIVLENGGHEEGALVICESTNDNSTNTQIIDQKQESVDNDEPIEIAQVDTIQANQQVATVIVEDHNIDNTIDNTLPIQITTENVNLSTNPGENNIPIKDEEITEIQVIHVSEQNNVNETHVNNENGYGDKNSNEGNESSQQLSGNNEDIIVNNSSSEIKEAENNPTQSFFSRLKRSLKNEMNSQSQTQLCESSGTNEIGVMEEANVHQNSKENTSIQYSTIDTEQNNGQYIVVSQENQVNTVQNSESGDPRDNFIDQFIEDIKEDDQVNTEEGISLQAMQDQQNAMQQNIWHLQEGFVSANNMTSDVKQQDQTNFYNQEDIQTVEVVSQQTEYNQDSNIQYQNNVNGNDNSSQPMNVQDNVKFESSHQQQIQYQILQGSQLGEQIMLLQQDEAQNQQLNNFKINDGNTNNGQLQYIQVSQPNLMMHGQNQPVQVVIQHPNEQIQFIQQDNRQEVQNAPPQNQQEIRQDLQNIQPQSGFVNGNQNNIMAQPPPMQMGPNGQMLTQGSQQQKEQQGSKVKQCPQCPYQTPSGHCLKRHINAIHAKLKPYACLHCIYRTSYRHHLVTHLGKVHQLPYVGNASEDTEAQQALSEQLEDENQNESGANGNMKIEDQNQQFGGMNNIRPDQGPGNFNQGNQVDQGQRNNEQPTQFMNSNLSQNTFNTQMNTTMLQGNNIPQNQVNQNVQIVINNQQSNDGSMIIKTENMSQPNDNNQFQVYEGFQNPQNPQMQIGNNFSDNNVRMQMNVNQNQNEQNSEYFDGRGQDMNPNSENGQSLQFQQNNMNNMQPSMMSSQEGLQQNAQFNVIQASNNSQTEVVKAEDNGALGGDHSQLLQGLEPQLFPVELGKDANNKQVLGCPVCEYRTGSRSHMDYHIKSVHEKMKKFGCPECNYKAANKSHMDVHIKAIHQGIKDFVCVDCDYQSSYKQHLRAHRKRVHPNENPDNFSEIKKTINNTDNNGNDTANQAPNMQQMQQNNLGMEENMAINAYSNQSNQFGGNMANPDQSNFQHQQIIEHGNGQQFIQSQNLIDTGNGTLIQGNQYQNFQQQENATNISLQYADENNDGIQGIVVENVNNSMNQQGQQQIFNINNSDNLTPTTMKIMFCSECDYKATQSSHLKEHIRAMHENTKFICPDCDFETSWRQTLSAHRKACHKTQEGSAYPNDTSLDLVDGNGEVASGVNNGIIKKLQCPHCNYQANKGHHMKDHIRAIHDKDQPYACPERDCTFKSSYSQHLAAHRRRMHQNSNQDFSYAENMNESMNDSGEAGTQDFEARAPKRKQEPSMQNIEIRQINDMSTLSRQQIQGQPQQTQPQPETMNFFAKLRRSLKSEIQHQDPAETNDMMIKPEDRSFNADGSMDGDNVRMTDNGGDKPRPFACGDCSYRAIQQTHLDNHVKAKHTKIRDYPCEHCDYKAIQKAHLDNHVKAIHAKIKDYFCPQCEYRASQKAHLAAHMTRIHGIVNPSIHIESIQASSQNDADDDGGQYDNSNPTMMGNSQIGQFNTDPSQGQQQQQYIQQPQIVQQTIIQQQPNQVQFNVTQQQMQQPQRIQIVQQQPMNIQSEQYIDNTSQVNSNRQFGNNGAPLYYVACPECDFKSTEKQHVDTHMRTFHNMNTTRAEKLKIYACPLESCSFTTAQKGNLDRHVALVHNNEKRFACPYCEHQTYQKYKMDKHIQSLHRKEEVPQNIIQMGQMQQPNQPQQFIDNEGNIIDNSQLANQPQMSNFQQNSYVVNQVMVPSNNVTQTVQLGMNNMQSNMNTGTRIEGMPQPRTLPGSISNLIKLIRNQN